MLDTLQNSLLSIIYPQECQVCSAEVEERSNGVACSACWASTRVFTGSEMLCAKCGALIGEESGPVAVHCHKCRAHHYDKAIAAGVYEKALAAAIIQLKISPYMPDRLGSLLISAAERLDLARIDVIIPVPLARARRIERGFNQAEVVADAIARLSRLPVDRLSLARKLHTPMHRIGMDDRARELTVQNAFEVVRPKLMAGKNILLVDDVLTSGATVSACAGTLKKNGASKVNVFTLARAVMH